MHSLRPRFSLGFLRSFVARAVPARSLFLSSPSFFRPGTWIAASIGCLLLSDGPVDAIPRIPRHNDEVLEKLPTTQSFLRRRSPDRSQSPSTLPLGEAVAEARRLVDLARTESDPRYLGRAQAVLAPWYQLADPPSEVRLLRAITRQSTHDFEGALRDLQVCLQESPSNAQAWLVKATIHTVRGEWQAARDAALALTPLTERLVSASLAASIASLNGQAEEACRLLESTLSGDRVKSPNMRLWAHTLLAETYSRRGQSAVAESHFKAAMRLGIRDAYLRGAYADFLLAEGRPAEVLSLLNETSPADGLLLRLALAEHRLRPGSASAAARIASLAQRFEAAHRRGEAVHQREEAMFELHLRNRPQRALELAKANWAVQREPADVKIFLESALAVGHSPAVNQLRHWLAESGLEDVHISRLLTREQARP